jgi:hypothetical protein
VTDYIVVVKSRIEMEKDALILGLEGIKRKIADVESDLSRLHKAELQFAKALRSIQDGELPLKPNGKRLKKGLTQNYIMELLTQYAGLTTEGVVLALKQDKNMDIARTTVVMNLSRMKDKGLIISDDDGTAWKKAARDNNSDEDEET